MKKYNLIALVIGVLISLPTILFAGNEQRIGQSGATELQVNPWTLSSGLAGSNIASVRGVEAMYQNIAGAAFTKSTELSFTHTRWLVGTGIGINNFGLTHKMGESGVLTMGVTSFSFGEIMRTTVANPDGGNGTFSIAYSVVSAGYSKEFSNSIYGGVNFKLISEGISDLQSSGLAIDAGIIYKTGMGKNQLGKKNRDNFRFGITLKNVGPTMMFTGDGLSFRTVNAAGIPMTLEYRSQDFEMPTQLSMGISYNIPIKPQVDTVANKITTDHNIEISTAYISNSFAYDQFSFGVEYSFKKLFQLRAGYLYEKNIMDAISRTIAYTGPSMGASVMLPVNKEKGSFMSIDYAYRTTANFSGIHTIGVRVIL
jgi:long-subunit fatty acid transport protein